MNYKGSCHCGAATFSFSLPADIYETEVLSCNCKHSTQLKNSN